MLSSSNKLIYSLILAVIKYQKYINVHTKKAEMHMRIVQLTVNHP